MAPAALRPSARCSVISPSPSRRVDCVKRLALGRKALPLLRSGPKLVSRGVCQEVVKLTEQGEVDCTRLPILKCWPHDGDPQAVGIEVTPEAAGTAAGNGRFITLGTIHTIHADDRDDPRPASHNIGMYRVQLIDETHLAMHWHLHHDGAALAVVEGLETHAGGDLFRGESVLPYAATAPMPPGLSELLLAGFLNGGGISADQGQDGALGAGQQRTGDRRIRARRCGPIGWDPAGDEPLGPAPVFEGPFGDHTGFYSMPDRYPLVDVTAITHRRDAVVADDGGGHATPGGLRHRQGDRAHLPAAAADVDSRHSRLPPADVRFVPSVPSCRSARRIRCTPGG